MKRTISAEVGKGSVNHYRLLRKVFGSQQIDDLIKRAKEVQQVQKRQRQRSREGER